ncbi:hypothetical protein GE09DRAFT_978526, partial [Coniochaeta sp. 2T2.1]
WVGADLQSGEEVAIKLTYVRDDSEALRGEKDTYEALAGGARIPRMTSNSAATTSSYAPLAAASSTHICLTAMTGAVAEPACLSCATCANHGVFKEGSSDPRGPSCTTSIEFIRLAKLLESEMSDLLYD